MSNVKLTVNQKEYAGWKTARVTRSIESISGSFELSVSEKWANQDIPWPIAEEDECTLKIDDTVLITGYVDRRTISYDATDHSLTVSGRDRTGALVDCSALLDKWEFKNVQVQTLAARVCDPLDIRVTVQARLGQAEFPKVAKLSIDPGDSSFEVIEKACRLAGVLPVSDGVGGLLLTRAGTARAATALVEGQNILAATADFDCSTRYRHYLVLGQHKGTDEFSGAPAATIKGTSEDLNVRRIARSLVIRPEGNVTSELAKRRAQWEAAIRAGRADSVMVTVQGWTQSNGVLWPINALVPLRSPMLGIDGDMLITEATYSIDEGGTTTTLTLKSPNSFAPEPVVAKTKGKKTSGKPFKELEGGV